jgi:hypothetical protein
MSVLLDPQATAPAVTTSRRAPEEYRRNMAHEAYTNSTSRARVRFNGLVSVPLSGPVLDDLGAHGGNTGSDHVQAFGGGA